MSKHLSIRAVLSSLMLLTLTLLSPGCISDPASDYNDNTPAKPEYEKLAGKTAAVMVLADETTLFAYPEAPDLITQALSSALVTVVPTVQFTNPKELQKFRQTNMYWEALPPAMLMKRLNVQRLIVVDLTHFSTHEPGNAHVWQGAIVAHVSVAEAESATPDNYAYRTTVHAAYPEKRVLGVVNSDEATVRLALLQTFARNVMARFGNPAEKD